MISARCILTLTSGEEKILDRCVSFTFDKELYMPYTKAAGKFYLADGEDISAMEIARIGLEIGGVKRHEGIPCSVQVISQPQGKMLTFLSQGYTVLLMQNEPYPKINSDMDLGNLITKNLNVPEISWEENTPQVGYIYVKEKSTVWEAVTAYSVKATGNYPYIRGTNKVCVTMCEAQTVDLSGIRVISAGTGVDTSLILSKVNMADINDEYSYTAEDSRAADYGIVREKYFPLDYQWLYSPEEGLAAKLNYLGRGVKERSVVYIGSCGEDLMDRAVNCGSLGERRINAIRIWGNSSGVFTRLKCYEDAYGTR